MLVRHNEPETESPIAVGPSPRMKAVHDFLRVIQNSDSTVLIAGESGTGKEVIARQIHDQSRRRHRPFLAVSCALLSETLIESELFGHERGAFTGAIGERPGRFELANGGTVLLDDIDDVPLAMQVKLLRVLQNRTIERLGGTRTIPINVRIIAATKKNLRDMIAAGTFREDLYYRLNVLPIGLPPLRARPEDIPVLTDHFLSRFCRERGEEVPALSPRIRHAFQAYAWPGNVRELENACERIAQTLTSDLVRTGRLSAGILLGTGDGVFATLTDPPAQYDACVPAPVDATVGISLDDQLRALESRLIAEALAATNGNKTRAAEMLRIERSTLSDRIKRLGLQPTSVASWLEPATEGIRDRRGW